MARPTAKSKKKEEEESREQDLNGVLNSSFKNSENRTKLDRYRDFRTTFLASEEGKRVLHDILGFAKLSAPIAPPFPEPVDCNRMLILEGGRELAIKIVSVLTSEPNMEQPKQTRRRLKHA